MAFLALPAAAGLIALAQPVVMTMFMHGAYEQGGVDRIVGALTALAIAVVPVGASGLVVRCFYSLGDFRTPVVVSVAMMASMVGRMVVFQEDLCCCILLAGSQRTCSPLLLS